MHVLAQPLAAACGARHACPAAAAGVLLLPHTLALTLPLTVPCSPAREVALEEFEDFSNVQDSVFVRIANIPLQESIRDLRWVGSKGLGSGVGAGSAWGKGRG